MKLKHCMILMAITFVATQLPCAPGPARRAAPLPPSALASLVPDISDLPAGAWIQRVETYPESAPTSCKITWRATGIEGRIELRMAKSDKGAVYTFRALSRACQEVGRDVSAQPKYAGLGEICFRWGDDSSGALEFVRGNVLATIGLHGPKHGQPLLALSRKVAARIAAALSGKPLPVSPLPVSAEELGVHGYERVAVINEFGKSAWGSSFRYIGVQYGNRLPRLIPAKQIKVAGQRQTSYMVPLSYFAATLSYEGHFRTEDNLGITLAGREIKPTGDAKALTVDGKRTKLDTPSEQLDGRLVVPISLLKDVLGLDVQWSSGGKVPIARLTEPR